jgi:hypothetical protein
MTSETEVDCPGGGEVQEMGRAEWYISVVKERWNHILTKLRQMDVEENKNYKIAL